jgi:hypothetical protein
MFSQKAQVQNLFTIELQKSLQNPKVQNLFTIELRKFLQNPQVQNVFTIELQKKVSLCYTKKKQGGWNHQTEIVRISSQMDTAS